VEAPSPIEGDARIWGGESWVCTVLVPNGGAPVANRCPHFHAVTSQTLRPPK
jgi:hypothetical protein